VKSLEITIKGHDTRIFKDPIDLLTLAKDYEKFYSSRIVAAVVNGELRELTYCLNEDCTVEFIDLTSDVGMKIYVRSLTFLFIKACKDIFPDCLIHIQHSLGNGLYCEIYTDKPLEEDDVEKIKARMQELCKRDIPIKKTKMPTSEAMLMFKKMGLEDKVRVLKYRKKPYINIYDIDGLKDYFYGYMVPSTGYLDKFDLKYYLPGVILQFPGKSHPAQVEKYQEPTKLSKVFREAERWAHILGVADVGALNDYIKAGEIAEIIRIAEALHEKKIAQIADRIFELRDRVRIVLIAGPSSSGKTTFAQRLIVQLRVNGLRPIAISLDDYFVERDKVPLDEEGKPDFEALEAIDIKLFNKHLAKLIQGQEVILPCYNFCTGEREYANKPIRIDKDHPLIIEGIHGLNDKLIPSIPRENKFKIYVSALTQLSIDNHNRISTTDTRLLRRIVRDSRTRATDAKKTIAMWPSVLRGAEKNIFPYQEDADVMFNSALVYELAVLKKYAEPLLQEIKPGDPEFIVANHLLRFLDYFLPIEEEEQIPLTSIIREFIGGCCFYDEK